MGKKNYFLLFITLLLMFVYAFTRYIWLGSTSIQQLPLYLLNKVFAISGVVIIGATIFISQIKKRNKTYNKIAKKQNTLLGLSGLTLIILHFLISVILFGKEYFSSFYQNNKLSISGELSLLFANIALILLIIAGIFSFIKVFSKVKFTIKNSYLQLIKIALVFTSFHLLFMGITSWFDFSSWNGGLPPMTLLAFSFILIVLVFRLIKGISNKKKFQK